MFKNNIGSYLMPQWWRRKTTTTKTPPDKEVETPKEFVISSIENKNKLINVSMEENEDAFVNINYKDLTYAEAAALSLDKEEKVSGSLKRTKSQNYNVSVRQLNKKNIDNVGPLDNEIFNHYRDDTKYKKSKQFKNKQHEMVQKKKAKKALEKQRRYA